MSYQPFHASRLGGTGLIADDLYLLGHHERTGRAFLRARPLGIGLAAAQLAELLLGGSIAFQPDGTVVAYRQRAPDDDLGRRALDQVIAENRPRPVRTLLLFFAQTAPGSVARRLEEAGYLRHAGSRIPGRPGRWVPVDASWAFASGLRVRSALDPARLVDPSHAVLAGLAEACGLHNRLAQYLVPGSRTVEEATDQLGPELRYLIAHTQAAVGSAVQSQRT